MYRFLFSLLVATLCGGCESMSSRMQDRFATAQPKLRMFEASAVQTYLAAQTALKRMDFTLTSSAQAQGRIQARSRVVPGDSLGGASQIFAELSFAGPAEGPTEVSVVLSRSIEGDFRAGPNSEPLREHGLYGSLFSAVQAVLNETKASPTKK